jgi:hypothetical protein
MKKFPELLGSFYYCAAFVAILAWAAHESETSQERRPSSSFFDRVLVKSAVPFRAEPAAMSSQEAVVPVLLVASDKVGSAQIPTAVENLNSVMEYAQAWYRRQLGKTFRLAPTRIVSSKLNAEGWIELSVASKNDERRFDYHFRAKDELLGLLPKNPHAKYVAAIFAGIRPDVWWGAADSGEVSVTAPRGSSVFCPAFKDDDGKSLSPECADAVYAVAHELGHFFGLEHTCDHPDGFPKDPRCGESAMQARRPPGMILLEGEKAKLRDHPYFN